MRLKDFKGEEAFKVMGKMVSCLRRMFQDKKASDIVITKKQGWILEFLEYSLCEQAGVWLDMFKALNPDVPEEEISTQNVVIFASEFMQDPELTSLFFSQGRTTSKTSIGSATENTEVKEN